MSTLKGRAKTWLDNYLRISDLYEHLNVEYNYSAKKKLQSKIDKLEQANEKRQELLTQKDKEDISDYYGVCMFDY